MLHLPHMSILKCSLSKLPPHMNYHSYPLYLDHLQLQHAICVTATILKLSETFQRISVIIKSMLKKVLDFIKITLLTSFGGCALAFVFSIIYFLTFTFIFLAYLYVFMLLKFEELPH